jgi:hypothetical protein
MTLFLVTTWRPTAVSARNHHASEALETFPAIPGKIRGSLVSAAG